jgi:regulator of replication initiation timing
MSNKPDYKAACDALRLIEEAHRKQIGELMVDNKKLLADNDKLRKELEKNRSFAV